MNDEQTTRDAAALDDATDHVIRKMTQVDLPDDAVARVMARVRGAAPGAGQGAGQTGAAPDRQGARGWFGALLEPRVSWGTAAAAAALAAILAVGVTLRVAGNERGGNQSAAAATPVAATPVAATPVAATPVGAPLVAAASPSPSQGEPLPLQQLPAQSHAQSQLPPTQAQLTTAAQGPASARSATAQSASAQSVAPAAAAGAVGTSRASAAAPQVARVHRAHGAEAARGIGGIDQTVTAAMVTTPDEEPARARTPQAGAPAAAQEAGARTERAIGPAPSNVKLDITITDQSAAGKPFTKTVTMIVADRESGLIHSETRMPFLQQVKGPATTVDRWDTEVLPLNVEAWPMIYSDGRVRVRLKLDYRAASQPKTTPGEPLTTAVVTKNISAVLSDGKASVVSQSADAATDRKVTVEVKATIQK